MRHINEQPASVFSPIATSDALVSIVLPTYNRASLLPQALDACLAQTYRNIEVIVVNDGSQDNTDEVLRKYALQDSRVRFISKMNEGIPDTVNCGFSEACGKYITWTSDDNYYYPDAIKEMVTFLGSHPDVAMVYTDCRYINGDGDDLGIVEAKEPDSLQYHCAPAGCLLFRHEVFEKVEPFRREWVRCHDFDFYHRIYEKFKVARLPRVLYAYRAHEASMSGNHEAHVIEHCTLMCTWVLERDLRAKVWAEGYAEIARSLGREGRNWRAVYYQLKAFLNDHTRLSALGDALWRTGYNSLPTIVHTAWRFVKRTTKLARPAR